MEATAEAPVSAPAPGEPLSVNLARARLMTPKAARAHASQPEGLEVRTGHRSAPVRLHICYRARAWWVQLDTSAGHGRPRVITTALSFETGWRALLREASRHQVRNDHGQGR